MRKITNVVLMGMGEPLYNFDNVRDAMAIAADGEGLSVSKRRITLSTSGVVPEIPRWGEEAGTMLAISLHAVRDELRDQLVPINKKWPIKDLLDACRAYPGLSNAKRITFEYVMLKGVNDSIADAKELVRLLAKIPAKINLIPFNPWPGAPYECSDWEQIEKFGEVVNRAGYASPVRSPRGRDIMAACGQLKSASIKQRASERLATPCLAPHEAELITRTIFRVLWAATVFVFAFAVALGVLFLLGALWVGDELRALAPDDPVLAAGSGWMGAAIFAVTVVPALTIVPALVAVIIGEALHIRSWMYYVLAGGAALLAVPLLARAPGDLASRALPSLMVALPAGQYMTIFAAAGFVGGFVYWLLAGRNA